MKQMLNLKDCKWNQRDREMTLLKNKMIQLNLINLIHQFKTNNTTNKLKNSIDNFTLLKNKELNSKINLKIYIFHLHAN